MNFNMSSKPVCRGLMNFSVFAAKTPFIDVLDKFSLLTL